MANLRKVLAVLVLAVAFLPAPRLAFAQEAESEYSSGFDKILENGIIFANICTRADAECECRDTGNCSLSDMMQIFVNISVFILGISGSVALLVFVYGGWLWITAAGHEKKLEKGKEAMAKAVIGLAIIFGAYAFINFIIAMIAGDTPGATLEETIDNATKENTTTSP